MTIATQAVEVVAGSNEPGADRKKTNGAYSVCGLVVQCRPEKAGQVASALEKIAGVEVHGGEAGKLIVTVEELPGEKKLIDRVTEINNTSGVLSASLIYTESDSVDGDDPDSDLEEQQ
jgi:nitrate reductase NapD